MEKKQRKQAEAEEKAKNKEEKLQSIVEEESYWMNMHPKFKKILKEEIRLKKKKDAENEK